MVGRGTRAGALAGLLSLLGAAAAVAQERPDGWGLAIDPRWWVWGAWGLGMALMMALFWGVVIVGIVFGIRWLAGRDGLPRSTDRALDILRQRYARGEIDTDEFEAKKRDLR
jgi:putative membrane protein